MIQLQERWIPCHLQQHRWTLTVLGYVRYARQKDKYYCTIRTEYVESKKSEFVKTESRMLVARSWVVVDLVAIFPY